MYIQVTPLLLLLPPPPLPTHTHTHTHKEYPEVIVTDEDEEAQESQEFPEVIIESDEESAQERPYSYSLKVIRPRSQGGSVVEKFQAGIFLTPHDIEVNVKRILKDKRHMIDSEFEFGYMDAGHGVKGKQYALETNDDVTDMYEMYGRKKGKKRGFVG